LFGAVCYAGFVLATRRVGRDEDPSTSLLYSALFGTLVTSAILPGIWQPIAAGDIWKFLLIGVQGSIGQFFLIHAFTRAEASAIAPFGYAAILFATGWGIALFGEWPDGWTVAGALVITMAGLYVWSREMRAARAA
ncbi:MAG: DMT family transporter, partial [Gemmobacter sp.]|nr:DMT family transporter [Gemmobacter sp.]